MVEIRMTIKKSMSEKEPYVPNGDDIYEARDTMARVQDLLSYDREESQEYKKRLEAEGCLGEVIYRSNVGMNNPPIYTTIRVTKDGQATFSSFDQNDGRRTEEEEIENDEAVVMLEAVENDLFLEMGRIREELENIHQVKQQIKTNYRGSEAKMNRKLYEVRENQGQQEKKEN